MRLSARVFAVLFNLFAIGIVVGQTAPPTPPQAGGLQAQGARFRLIRSISGSKGAPQGGKFAMEDPRSVFYVPDDKQVIVYMEWEGPIGSHHIEGFWKNPAGKVSVLSDFQYDARDKLFGAYWTLAISESMQVGTWTMEARVDGEPAGSHSFQILSGTRPGDVIPSRHMLKPAELYDRALKSTVEVNKFSRDGELLGQASGTLVSPGLVLTAFEAIDGASDLRIVFADRHGVATNQVLAWNRRQDWAILRADLNRQPLLERAAPDSWNVGDYASFLEKAPEGNYVVASVSIDGKSNFAAAGPRLNLSVPPTGGAIGSAVLNEYGEVIGVVGGSLIPGASALDIPHLASPGPRAGGTDSARGGLAVPISSVSLPPAGTPATPLETLAAKGEFLPRITASRNVSFGELARSLDNRDGMASPLGYADTFSHHDPSMVVYVLWEAKEKFKGAANVLVYDLDNRLVVDPASVKPAKVDLRPGKTVATFWKTSVATMPPGIYRVDVLLGDSPAWRTFFRITE